jgi:hypothetical protein
LSSITGNQATGTGGGIENGGGLVITHSTLSGNTGERGGAIHNVGEVDMTDSTIANNTARQTGGGLQNEFSSDALKGDVQLNGVTIAGNKGGALPAGCGVANKKPAKLTVANSIIAGNHDLVADRLPRQAVVGGCNLSERRRLQDPRHHHRQHPRQPARATRQQRRADADDGAARRQPGDRCRQPGEARFGNGACGSSTSADPAPGQRRRPTRLRHRRLRVLEVTSKDLTRIPRKRSGSC